MVSFDKNPKTRALAERIIDRLSKLDFGDEFDDNMSTSDVFMNLAALKHSYPEADLQVLLDSDDFDFVHDVYGIDRHIDKSDSSPTGGQLLHCFYPRFMRGNRALERQEAGRGKRPRKSVKSALAQVVHNVSYNPDKELDDLAKRADSDTREIETTEYLRTHPDAEASDGGRLG